MKKVEANMEPCKRDEVKMAFSAFALAGRTASATARDGRQKGRTEISHGSELATHFRPTIKTEVVRRDRIGYYAVDATIHQAPANGVRDARDFVSPIENTMRMRAEATAEEAV